MSRREKKAAKAARKQMKKSGAKLLDPEAGEMEMDGVHVEGQQSGVYAPVASHQAYHQPYAREPQENYYSMGTATERALA